MAMAMAQPQTMAMMTPRDNDLLFSSIIISWKNRHLLTTEHRSKHSETFDGQSELLILNQTLSENIKK